MNDNDIHEICHDCALARNWKPVNKPVGMWTGTCPVCKQEKPLSADRDYIIPNRRRATTTEALVAICEARKGHIVRGDDFARIDNKATGDKND